MGLSSYQQGSFQSTTGQAALCYTEGPYENLCKPSSSTSVRIQISDANWRNKHYIVVSALAENPVLMEGRHRSSISISIESNDSLYQALTFNQIALIIAEPEPDSTVPQNDRSNLQSGWECHKFTLFRSNEHSKSVQTESGMSMDTCHVSRINARLWCEV